MIWHAWTANQFLCITKPHLSNTNSLRASSMPGTVRKAARLHKALIQVQTCAAQGKFAEAFQRVGDGKGWLKRKREGQWSKDLKGRFWCKRKHHGKNSCWDCGTWCCWVSSTSTCLMCFNHLLKIPGWKFRGWSCGGLSMLASEWIDGDTYMIFIQVHVIFIYNLSIIYYFGISN